MTSATETVTAGDVSVASDADVSIVSDPNASVRDDPAVTTTNVTATDVPPRSVAADADATSDPNAPITPGAPVDPDEPAPDVRNTILDPADLSIPAAMRTPAALPELHKVRGILTSLATRLDENNEQLREMDRRLEGVARDLERKFTVLFNDNYETRAILYDTLDTVINMGGGEGASEMDESFSDESHDAIPAGTDLASELGRVAIDRGVTFATPPRNATRAAASSRGPIANAPQTPGRTPRTAWRRHGTAANLQRVVTERNADRLEALARIDPTFAGHNPNA